MGEGKPIYVSLGSKEQYYISFSNGSRFWNGPDSLHQFCNETRRNSIQTVAFGEDFKTWFAVHTDGSWSHEGDVPQGLLDQIKKNWKRKKDIVIVRLGPKGEWFVKNKEGEISYGGMSDSQRDKVREYKERIKDMVFGGGGNILIRYT